MQIILKETIYCDVDETLIFNHQGTLEVDYYGQPRMVRPHEEHIAFLKSLKARGYHITVQSGNGAQWAANVVKALGLEDIVDDCRTKPFKVIDDKPIEEWMPRVIYIPDAPRYFFQSGDLVIQNTPYITTGETILTNNSNINISKIWPF